MPNVDRATHENRKEKVFLALRSSLVGMTEAELEQETGIQRRTLNNYLRALDMECKVFKDGTTWIALPYDEVQLRKFALSPEEAMTLYLAARLFVKQQDKRNEPAETALMKLADVLTADAGVGSEIHQAARELSQRSDAGNYNKVFRAVMQAYIYRRVLRITYSPAHGKPFETEFAPYLLEPSAIGYTTYAIGHSKIVNALRTYKLERIQSAALTRDEYAIPDDFPGLEILRNAWSIIHGEEVVTVKLRFSPSVRARVEETRWHPSQEKQEDSDNPGYLLWQAQVADTTDMLPWVKGWGAEVEVLAPQELREALMSEARKLARLYQVTSPEDDTSTSRLLRLWGKTERGNPDPNVFHPALFHMLDVGFVARELLSNKASPRWRHVLATALNVDPVSLSDWLPWFIALHDIGKLSLPFQEQNPTQGNRLVAEGFQSSERAWHGKPYHALVSALFAVELFNDLALSESFQRIWQDAMAGHHGTFATTDALNEARYLLKAESSEWRKFRIEASSILKECLAQLMPERLLEPTNISTATMALTGFTILCDWLGSNSHYFQIRPEVHMETYKEESANRAKRAVEAVGLFQSIHSNAPTDFASLFAHLPNVRPLQTAMDAIPDALLAQPCLAIIEAPTGEGKTEAAWALAHRIAQAHGSDELYYALPTTATSNQMFGRLQTYLREQLHLPVQVRLIHGQAYLMEDDWLNDGLDNSSKEPQSVSEWLGSDKRKALIMPFGVGTIDQAELAALTTSFVALRLIGLAGKTIILDEVHAYDTYMSTIVEQLLKWLSALGTSVILLSATLPLAQRLSLIDAYRGERKEGERETDSYPSLCVISQRDTYIDAPQAVQGDRVIQINHLHFTDEDAKAKARWLLDAVKEGGCVCWITNTVDRAQTIFAALDKLAQSQMQTVDRMLLHARFPFDERQTREAELKRRYGPKGERPGRGIVVGTQVLEQSLDLDFDLMVSDLAPIDFLLQRAGRLHRHERGDRGTPHLWINGLVESDGRIKLTPADKAIYDEFILLQTWQALNGRTQINLPGDYRRLIEAVYDDREPGPDNPLYEAWGKLQNRRSKAIGEARLRILPEPDPESSFCSRAARMLFEEDEDSAAWIVAQTRLGQESLIVIPLERNGNRAHLWPDVYEVDLDATVSRDVQKRLMRRSIRLSHRKAVEALKQTRATLPRLFQESALLKGCVPLWLTDGHAQLLLKEGILHLQLDPRLGLVITSPRKENKV